MSAATGTCLRVVLAGVPKMAHGAQCQLGSGWPREMRADRPAIRADGEQEVLRTDHTPES